MLTVILVLVSVYHNCQVLLFVTLEDTTAQKHCILGSGCCRGCLFGKDRHIGKNSCYYYFYYYIYYTITILGLRSIRYSNNVMVSIEVS